MKQIDIIKTYSQKRCLVVDDVPDIRTALKRILVNFGSTQVDTAGNPQEAIALCERNTYDIVLADYNLGKGKNGQQLLEELRHQGLLKNTAIYVMITAEASSHFVLHALEYEPDDYLNKPINKDSLRPRLDNALLKNETLMKVFLALDAKRLSAAIEACREVVRENGRFQNDAKKILGEFLCKEKEFTEAQQLYSNISPQKRPIWASIGLAKALLGLNEFDDAEKLLVGLTQEHQYCVSAHDLLAQAYEAKNKLDQAQHLLATAVKMSPMSAVRQRELGRISHQTGDSNTAAHAFRSAIKSSKNSSQEIPQDYTNLAQTLTSIISSKDQVDSKLASEALSTLQQHNKKFGRHPLVNMYGKLIEADLHEATGNTAKAEHAANEALVIYAGLTLSVVDKTPTVLSIDCAKALMKRGRYDEGEKLLQEVAKLNDDHTLAIKIDRLLREPVTREGIKLAAALNRKGIEYYQNDNLPLAIESFQNVINELPNHLGLNFNLIQALISKSKNKNIPLNETEISLVEGSFQRIGKINQDSPYVDRYNYLSKRFDKLKVQQKETNS